MNPQFTLSKNEYKFYANQIMDISITATIVQKIAKGE